MGLNQIVLQLTKDNDKFLLQDVVGLTMLHQKNIYGKGVVFSDAIMRRLNGQFPENIKTKSMTFNENNFNYEALRQAIKDSEKNTMLIYQDINGALVNSIYLGGQFGSDPFTRVVLTDKLDEDIYCVNKNILDLENLEK